MLITSPKASALHHPNGAIAEFLGPNGNRLLITMPSINAFEREALQSGELRAKLHHCDKTNALIIVFSFFGLTILDFDCPFDASLITLNPQQLITDNDFKFSFKIVAIDSVTQESVAYRLFESI